MNINKVDKITIQGDNIKRLDDWWLYVHEGAFNYVPPVLEEGLIILLPSDELLADPEIQAIDQRIYFKQLNQAEVYYEFYRTRKNNQVEKLMTATKNYEKLKSEMHITSYGTKIGIKAENAISFLDSSSTPHIALMNYMAFYPDRVSSERVRTMVSKKQAYGKKKPSRAVTNMLYSVFFPNEKMTEQEKQEFKSWSETWVVEGQEWKVYSGQKGVGKALLKESVKGQDSTEENKGNKKEDE